MAKDEQLRGSTNAVSPEIATATSFHTHPDLVRFSANDLTQDAPHFYTRWSNPTVAALEEKLAQLEGAEAGLCFASGMAAISALFLTQLRNGDHLILSEVCYAGEAELRARHPAKIRDCRFGCRYRRSHQRRRGRAA